MDEKYISVDGIKFHMNLGKPLSFDGIYSGQKLAGIELCLTVYGSKQEQAVLDFLDQPARYALKKLVRLITLKLTT